jgi:uncharacterized membrane protein YraQ (UPF0718 family)
MTSLLAAALAVAAAPLLDRALAGRPAAAVALQDAARTAVFGIVLLHVLPSGLGGSGWIALGALLLGLVIIRVVERVTDAHDAVRSGRVRGPMLLVILALALHHLLDGVALALPEAQHDGSAALDVAVIAHTLPVSLLAWRFVRHHAGPSLATLTLAGIMLATAVGFGFGATLQLAPDDPWIGLSACFLSGALLHAASHRLDHGPRQPFASGVGTLLGLGVAGWVVFAHPLPARFDAELAIGPAFLAIADETAPAVLLGFAIAGWLKVVEPPELLRRLAGRGRVRAAAAGAVMGIPLPLCSCSALPVYEGMLARGVPRAAALSFLIGGPEIGVGTLAVSTGILGGPATALRVGVATLAAFLVGLVLGGPSSEPSGASQPASPSAPPDRSWRRAAQYAFGELADHTVPWILLGILLASVLEPYLEPQALAGVPDALAVPLLALIGLPVFVCASGSTPLAAVLLHKGVSMGAVLAFLITGPATNITTFGVLSRRHGARFAFLFGAVVAAVAITAGWLVDLALPNFAVPISHPLTPVSGSLTGLLALTAFGALTAASLLRTGLDGFLHELGLLTLLGHDEHEDGCGCDHDHTLSSAPMPALTGLTLTPPTRSPVGGPGATARPPTPPPR